MEFFKSLEIRNLYFRFAGGSRLLENVNLQVRIGECIALIGESGSGKSTLGQILQKFYIFESGEIVVNSTQLLQHVKTSDWRNLIGVVPQEITIFSGTILDNIMLGEQNGHEDVIKFCREFNFEKYIAQLPQGYATIVGEDGLNLSGGQKQIIGLIRALYKRPHLLILDEPTSAMDRKTERFVIDLINGLKRNAAILIISHRIQSLKCMADRIYVLENGSILLNGNHFELMQSSNFYSEYWNEVGGFG